MKLSLVTCWHGKELVILLKGGWNGTDILEISRSEKKGIARRAAIRKLQRIIAMLEAREA